MRFSSLFRAFIPPRSIAGFAWDLLRSSRLLGPVRERIPQASATRRKWSSLVAGVAVAMNAFGAAALTTLYDADFSGSENSIGGPPATDQGPFIRMGPSGVPIGDPRVASAYRDLTDRPLVFEGNEPVPYAPYDQIRFDTPGQHQEYRIDFDIQLSNEIGTRTQVEYVYDPHTGEVIDTISTTVPVYREISLFADRDGGLSSIGFAQSGSADPWHSRGQRFLQPFGVGGVSDSVHISVHFDLVADSMSVYADGRRRHSSRLPGPANGGTGDIRSFRISGGAQAGFVVGAIDNVRITAVVPEPTTAALLGLGLLGLALRTR